MTVEEHQTVIRCAMDVLNVALKHARREGVRMIYRAKTSENDDFEVYSFSIVEWQLDEPKR